MKSVFCIYQEKRVSQDDDRIKLMCYLYNKECPYNKAAKAYKKCQNFSEADNDRNRIE